MGEMGTTQQELSVELANLKNIPQEAKDAVLNEFLETSNILEVGQEGTVTFTSPFTQGASQDITSFEAPSVKKPLDFLYKVDPAQLAALIKKEHPQTIAVILSQLRPAKASAILAEFPQSTQSDVARRLADINKISPEILTELEKALEERLLDVMEGRTSVKEGKDALMEILNQTDKHTEQKIVSGIIKDAPSLAGDIGGQLYRYEDIENVDDESLRQILRLADIKDVAMALKGSTLLLAEKIYKVLPIETAKALKGDTISLNREASQDKIIAAKQQLRNILRGLVALGKIRFLK